jgi:hypothetical protein
VVDPTLMSVEEWLDAECKTVVRASLATGGCGNEQIIGTLGGSMFHLRFWESSHRGGLHVYEVPKGEWETVSQLGAIVAEGCRRLAGCSGWRAFRAVPGRSRLAARCLTPPPLPGTGVGWWRLLHCDRPELVVGGGRRGLVGGGR